MRTLLLLLTTLVLALPGLRHPADPGRTTPFAWSPTAWAMATGVALALTLLALRRERREGSAPWCTPEARVFSAGWIALASFLWSAGEPQDLRDPRILLLAAPALLLARSAWQTRRAWAGRAFGGLSRARGPAAALLAASTFLALLVTWLGPAPVRSGATAWLSYPLYAFVQLVLLLAVPAAVFDGLGFSRRAIALGCAGLFALAHWPQPLLFVGGFVAALAWSWAYLRGVPLVVVALSMGWLGAATAHHLPEAWTEHLRVGPALVAKRLHADEVARYEARVDALARALPGETLSQWLTRIVREIEGRTLAPPSAEASARALEDAQRARTVRMFFGSEEFRRRHGLDGGLSWVDRSAIHGSAPDPHEPAYALYDSLRSRAHFEAVGGRWGPFLRSLTEILLGRTPTDVGLAAWDTTLSDDDRELLVEHLMKRAGIEDPRHFVRPENIVPLPGITAPAVSSSKEARRSP